MSDIKEMNINGTTYDIKAVSVVDKNGGDALKYWTGVEPNYELVDPKDTKTFYTCVDTGNVYLGEVLLCPSKEFANNDLSNLTTLGNARFQYVPFAINTGTVDDEGENATLTLIEGAGVEEDITGTVPNYSGSPYGQNAQVSRNTMFDEVKTLLDFTASFRQVPGGYSFLRTMIQAILPDNSTMVLYQYDTPGYQDISYKNVKYTFTQPTQVKGIAISIMSYGYAGYPPYGSGYITNMSFTERVNVNPTSEFLYAPCTLTTCDGRTKQFIDSGAYNVNTLYNQDISFEQPALAANGTLGGKYFACFASSEYNATNNPAWKAFNGITSDLTTTNTYWCSSGIATEQYIGFYNQTALNVTALRLYNQQHDSGNGVIASGKIQASNDNVTYTDLTTFNNNTFENEYIDIDLSDNEDYYNYYRIVGSTYTGTYATMGEVAITATYKSKIPDREYAIFRDVETGELSLVPNFRIEKVPSLINVAIKENAISTSVNAGDLDNAFDGTAVQTAFVGLYNGGVSIEGVCYIGQRNLTQKIKKIVINQGGGGGNYNLCVSSVKIQVSEDGENWIDVQTANNLTNAASAACKETIIEVDDYTVPDVPYQMRLLANSAVVGSNSYSWYINEVEFYEEAPSYLNISTVPAVLYIDSFIDNNKVKIGTVTTKDGIIKNLTNNQFNMNGYWEFANLPDFAKKISITAGSYTAPYDGWIVTDTAVIRPLSKGETTTAAGSQYFAPMRGY